MKTVVDFEYFEFGGDLTTGIDLIDRQHREYGRRVNGFLKHCADEGCAPEDVKEAFDFLRLYVVEHFGTEEALMETFGYPQMAAHVDLHRGFRSWIDDTAKKVNSIPGNRDSTLRVSYKLVDWFQRHIKTVDKKLTQYLKERAKEDKTPALVRLVKGIVEREDG